IVFTIFLAFGAFYFSNTILPHVHLKFYSLLFDIRKQKPALDIKEGVFYRGISGFALKIKHKDPDNKTLYGIMVYDHSQGRGNDNVVLADKGDIELSNTAEHLILTLYRGKQYQDIQKRGVQIGEVKPEQTIMEFKQWRKIFDLREFKMTRTDQGLFKYNYIMLNAKQLRKEADSSRKDIEKRVNEIRMNNSNYFTALRKLPDSIRKKSIVPPVKIDINNVFKRNINLDCLNQAESNITALVNYMQVTDSDLEFREDNYVSIYCEWYRKFSLSFACLVLLFVGCAMGAIVRKGGFGMPILIAVLYFVVFHVLNVIGEKLAKELIIPASIGMWLSSIVLFPLALFLTYKANNDSVIFRTEWYGGLLQSLKLRLQNFANRKNIV
ncbi:MAG: putative permease, partial [Bacteroidota bacterium]|nr:putative permease [Bacteroidota bacterium]